MAKSLDRSVLEIRPAKDSLTTFENFIHVLASLRNTLKTSLLLSLFGQLDTITLEIASLNQTIYFIVTCPTKIEPIVRSQIAAQFPDAVITTMTDYLEPWLTHGCQSVNQLLLAGPNYLPINTIKAAAPDPMVSLIGVLSKILPNQAGIIQLVLSAAPKGWANLGRGIIIKGIGTAEKKEQHPQKAFIEQKIALPGFNVDIRVAGVAPDQTSADLIVTQLATAFGVFALAESNSFRPRKIRPSGQLKLKKAMVMRSADFTPKHHQLNYLEIASIYHLPSSLHASLRNLAWGKTLKGEPPPHLPIAEGLSDEEKTQVCFFARTEFKNRSATFGIKNGNDRRRHVYILGKSGTGKSTLIANMAASDMRNKAGLAVIDPHGDLTEILLDFVPSYRVNDVIYLDPSNRDSSFHINPLYVKNPENRELVASGIVSIFSKIYGNSWGPRLEYILRNTLLTLVQKPGTTLMDVPRILVDGRFRAEFISDLKDDVLLTFWEKEYNAYTEKFRSEAIAPILNKVGQFITSPIIRNIIGSPTNSFDLEDVMDQGKIVLLNLAQGRIGEDNAALLGAMIITQIQIAAMNRINVPEEQRRDFYLYVDEFQNFATTSFVKILSEARKFHLNLILANQYTAQLPEEIQKAIFGNAGTIISFVVGADDATRLMAELGNLYTQDDLVNLAKYQIVTKLTVNGAISTPFPAYTLPLPFSKTQNRDKVIRLSKERYYKKPTVEIPNEPPVSGNVQEVMPTIIIPSTNSYRAQRPSRPTPRPEEPLIIPDLSQLDATRRKGFRPNVVGCFLNDKRILLVYQKVYKLWQLPQGGIDNKESLQEAVMREMSEEVGDDFMHHVDVNFQLAGIDQIEFPPEKQDTRSLKSDDGTPQKMIGKKYYFMMTQALQSEIKIDSTEYDEYRWVTYDEAVRLVKMAGQGGKLRITTKVLSSLKDRQLLL